MKFCSKCGNQLSDIANFCDKCGSPVSNAQTPPPIPGANENVTDDTKRKEVFVGVKRKCPVCGVEVPAFALTCPDGHELAGVKVSNIAKEFQEGLVKYEGKEERDFVASFPIPNEREELGNFMLMVASILKQDMQNGADQMRVSSFSSKFDEIKSKVYMMLKADDPIVGETKKWDSALNELYENYKKIIEERTRLNEKKLKEQRKFKYTHPVLHKFLRIFTISAVSAVLFLGFILVWILSDDGLFHKGKVVDIPQNEIYLPYQLTDYFEVVSDGTITTFNGNTNYRVEFKVRNVKPIPNNIKFGYGLYINDDYLFFDKIEAQLRYIKSGDSGTLVIEDRDSSYKLENATSLHFRIN
ncbi:MAG: zinc ribbon domain-containing protein [Treponema sp.]|uniref:zinc ribbon domain-containing protein n=1 Tax=Treponema sp. TaxID=166 RepID=UPI002A911BF5|nr:zinc ribbon domain-containing protein [Treponema sp.]MDY6397302.1 zinc ribbon domain-containing protein [Treponema sp.]